MKIFGFFLALFLLQACRQHANDRSEMNSKMDSLQKQLDESYKPGLGEFMTGIQVHHAKLWFAGQNQNWALADFEIHEMQESLEDIQKFCRDRPEVKAIGMINPAFDSINNAIRLKNIVLFKSGFILLTNTCNNCHQATKHEFNVVTIPTGPPVTNQDFRPAK